MMNSRSELVITRQIRHCVTAEQEPVNFSYQGQRSRSNVTNI